MDNPELNDDFSLGELKERLRHQVKDFDGLGELSQETVITVAYIKQISAQSRDIAVNMMNLAVLVAEASKIVKTDESFTAILAAFHNQSLAFNRVAEAINQLPKLNRVADECVARLREVINEFEDLKTPAEAGG